MALVLNTPEIIGEVDPDTLRSIDAQTYFSRFDSDLEMQSNARRVHDAIQALSGRELPNIVYDSKIVKPGHVHRAGQWHTDQEGFVVSSTQPTQFVVGRLGEKALSEITGQKNKSHADMTLLAYDLRTLTDGELEDCGLHIWSPEPYQIVHKAADQIHRSSRNNTKRSYKRVFMYAGIY